MSALVSALLESAPGLKVHVRTQAPRWLITDFCPGVETSEAPVDVGMLQHNGLDIDFPRTLAAHEEFCAGWDRAVEREAAFLGSIEAGLVAADIPALAFAAAARAGIPAVGVANFSWDWILRSYSGRDPRWGRIADRYAAAYGGARELLRLPLHGELPAFRSVTDVPLLVRRSRLGREEARRAAGLEAERRPAVLVTFGGLGSGPLDLSGGDDLREFVFVGFGEKPRGLKAGWIGFPPHARLPFVDLLAACDLVLGKPGYGLVSESLAHRRKLLYLPRNDFAEIPFLTEGLSRLGTAALMPREDFHAGRWRRHLEALRAAPDRWAMVPVDGDEVVARRLLETA